MSLERPTKLPTIITTRLAEVRRGIRSYVSWDAITSSSIWVLLLFWLITAADYIPIRLGSTEMPLPVRGVALCGLILGTLVILWRVGLSRLRVRVSDASAANLLERHYKEIKGKLLTSIQLADKPPPPDAHPELYHAMVDRVTEEAAALLQPFRVADIFDWKPLALRSLVCVLLLIATGFSAFSHTAWFSLACQRLFALSNENWPRQNRLIPDGIQLVLPSFSGETITRRQPLNFEKSQLSVPRGSSGILRIIADTNAPEVPELCTLTYRMPDGQRGQAALKGVNGGPEDGQLFILDGPPFESMVDSMTLDIYGGDFRLRDFQVNVIEPAVLGAMAVECVYPAYLFEKETGRWSQETLDYRFGMQVPEGTHCVLVGKSPNPLSAVEYTIRTTSDGSATPPTIVKQAVSGNEFRIPLQPWKGNVVIECLAYDKAGLPAAQVQRYQLGSVPDTVPVVSTRLVGIGTEITAKAYIPIQGRITDDHRVSSSKLQFGAAETGNIEVVIPVTASGEVDFILDLQQLSEAGQITLPLNSTVGLSISSLDFYDLDPAPHLGLGEPVQLTVVTPEQLVLSLEKRELSLRGRLEQIIAELTEMQLLLGKIEKSPWNRESLEGVDTSESEEDNGDENTANTADQESSGSDKTKELAAARRRQTLFVQQTSVQADKSFDEVNGVMSGISQIRSELVHNRVDSTDRRERLEIRIEQPLKSILEGSFDKLRTNIKALNRLSADSPEGFSQTSEAIQLTNLVINDLNAVLQNMLDIESYNEIVDMVRAMLEQQEKILERTKSEQKRKVLDLFEP